MLLGLDQESFQKDEISGHGEKTKEPKWDFGANFHRSLVKRQSKCGISVRPNWFEMSQTHKYLI